MEKEEFKKNSQNEFKNKWYEKRMYKRMYEEIDKGLSWKWLVQSDFKVRTEATICAAQGQALRTNYKKNKIDKTSEIPLCRMCGERVKLCSI